MKFSPVAIVLGLVALTQAAPASVTGNPSSDAVQALEARTIHQECKQSSYSGYTGKNSAEISDCQTIVKNIDQHGIWHQFHNGDRTLVHFGTCQFVINFSGNCDVYVGNGDIIDAINTSIKKYGKDGKVAASGRFYCKCAGLTRSHVNWFIHNIPGASQ